MPQKSASSDKLERLQKVLAAGGLGSRRYCEELIVEGRVEVDRKVVTELGTRVDPDSQAIRVDGVPLKRQRRQYFAVHKPTGVVSTSRDQWRRARVIDLVDSKDRVFTIGRLDKESSGLILVTNDGSLANRLTHPRYKVPKTYQVTVAGHPKHEVIQKLRRGLILSDGPVRPDSVVIKKRLKQSSVLEIVLSEGRNREIRRMLARVDHKVVKLHRVAIGPIRLGMLPKGAHRELTRDEVNKLKAFGSSAKKVAKKGGRKKSRGAKSAAGPGKRRGAASKQTKGRGKVGNKSPKGKTPKMGVVLGGSSGGDSSKSKSSAKTKRKKPRS